MARFPEPAKDALSFPATHRYARMAPRKAQPIMDMIRGLPAGQALDILRNDSHRASALIFKVLASAVNNAMQNEDVRPNRLVVSEAVVQQGPLLFGRVRYRPASMGRSMPYRRRTCHLHVKVADPELTTASASAES
ncbi:MAG: 50S ribosomal protein L22 [Planctomycetota bacterium]